MKFHYSAIEIRHEPDGELYAYLKSPTFGTKDLMKLIEHVLNGSNNFSVRGVETSKTHNNFHNDIRIYRNE